MKSNKLGRVNSEIQTALSNILTYEMNNPLFKGVIVSILRVDTTPDLKYSKITVSIFPDQNKQNVFDGIKSSIPFLRKEVAHKIKLRVMPELQFYLDDSEEYAQKIEDLITKINGDKEWFLMKF